MVKSQLITVISSKLPQLPIKDVELSLHHIINMMSNSLCSGQRIEIRDFGCFSLRYRAPRNAHNPKTGEKVATIGKYAPHYKPGKALREQVNQAISETEEA